LATTSSSSSLSVSHSVPVSIIDHRSSVIRLNPQVSLGWASFGLRQPERHRYRSSKSMAETMDAASIESDLIRIEWATPYQSPSGVPSKCFSSPAQQSA
jgi:hypothetical protein